MSEISFYGEFPPDWKKERPPIEFDVIGVASKVPLYLFGERTTQIEGNNPFFELMRLHLELTEERERNEAMYALYHRLERWGA